MVAFGNRIEPRRVVSVTAGPGTGESIYLDEYGAMWITDVNGGDQTGTAAPTQAIVRDGMILARAVATTFRDDPKEPRQRPRDGRYGPQWGNR